MKNCFYFIFYIAFQLTIHAQTTVGNGSSPGEANVKIGDLNMNNFRSYNLNYDEIKGSPFIELEKLKGHVVLIDKSRTTDLMLQYDIYQNEFFYTSETGEELVIDQNLIREINMTGVGESYHFKRMNPKYPLTFYEVIYETDALSLFCEMDINFYEAKDQGISKTDAKFSRVDKYFALQKGESPKRIKLKKKDIYKYFSKADQMILDEIVEDQQLSLRKRKDVKLMFLKFKSKV